MGEERDNLVFINWYIRKKEQEECGKGNIQRNIDHGLFENWEKMQILRLSIYLKQNK